MAIKPIWDKNIFMCVFLYMIMTIKVHWFSNLSKSGKKNSFSNYGVKVYVVIISLLFVRFLLFIG